MITQLKLLSKIAESEPQIAYSAFVCGFTEKLTFFMETIAKLRKLLKLLEDIVHFIFIPEIIGDHICSDYYLILLSLSSEFGALGIPIFHEIACSEYKNSKKINIVFV